MTLLAWGMFLVGLAVGMLIGCLSVCKSTKDQVEVLSGLNKFCINYAEITDRQYNILDKYIDKRLSAFQTCVENLCDITKDAHEADVEFIRNFSNLSVKIQNDNSAVINSFHADIKDLCDLEDQRWNLLHEYFTNNIKEDNANEQEMGTTDGASESGDDGNQASEQAEVFSGTTDGELVQCELEEDRISTAPEAS